MDSTNNDKYISQQGKLYDVDFEDIDVGRLLKELLDEAKKDFPNKNSNPHADSFKVEEEFEDAVLDWFEKWFGDVEP